jgi:hypothetical protein
MAAKIVPVEITFLDLKCEPNSQIFRCLRDSRTFLTIFEVREVDDVTTSLRLFTSLSKP